MEDEFYPQEEILDAKLAKLITYPGERMKRFCHQVIPSQSGGKIKYYSYHYPSVFSTVIGNVNELNRTMCRLLDRPILCVEEADRLVPVMILRGLIDYAFLLDGYILSDNKQSFVVGYKHGRELNQQKYNGKGLTTKVIKDHLEQRFEGITELYDDCCEYVHSGYSHSKRPHGLDDRIHGRYGFRGKVYKSSRNAELFTPGFPYCYDEECEMVDCAIQVNEIILALFETIEKEKLYDEQENIVTEGLEFEDLQGFM